MFSRNIGRTACFGTLLGAMLLVPPAAMAANVRGLVQGQSRYSPMPFPIRGARVDLMDARAQSVVATSYAGQDGLYYFSNIRPGNYVVRVNGKYFPITVGAAATQDIAPVRVAM
jgi:hypothetical protein